MAISPTSFQVGNVPPHRGRKSKAELYHKPVRRAEKQVVDRLPELVDAILNVALGNAKQYLINHKTGMVEEVPADAATQLKAATYLVDRIAGKAETKRTHEIGPEAKQVFQVLLGAPAQEHWQGGPVIEMAVRQELLAPVDDDRDDEESDA